jgi:hypothetical protein
MGVTVYANLPPGCRYFPQFFPVEMPVRAPRANIPRRDFSYVAGRHKHGSTPTMAFARCYNVEKARVCVIHGDAERAVIRSLDHFIHPNGTPTKIRQNPAMFAPPSPRNRRGAQFEPIFHGVVREDVLRHRDHLRARVPESTGGTSGRRKFLDFTPFRANNRRNYQLGNTGSR